MIRKVKYYDLFNSNNNKDNKGYFHTWSNDGKVAIIESESGEVLFIDPLYYKIEFIKEEPTFRILQ